MKRDGSVVLALSWTAAHKLSSRGYSLVEGLQQMRLSLRISGVRAPVLYSISLAIRAHLRFWRACQEIHRLTFPGVVRINRAESNVPGKLSLCN